MKEINSACLKMLVSDKKASFLRHATSTKGEFTMVNDYFEDKHNAVAELPLQALNNSFFLIKIISQ
jgi:hypothetical protein